MLKLPRVPDVRTMRLLARPPLVLGHTEQPDAPAARCIQNLYAVVSAAPGHQRVVARTMANTRIIAHRENSTGTFRQTRAGEQRLPVMMSHVRPIDTIPNSYDVEQRAVCACGNRRSHPNRFPWRPRRNRIAHKTLERTQPPRHR